MSATAELGDLVRVGRSDTAATVVELHLEKDAAGGSYVMAVLVGARDRRFREEASRLTVVERASKK